MISLINKNKDKLAYKQISKYLNIDDSKNEIEIKENNAIDNINGVYDEEDFMKNEIFEVMIQKLYPPLEIFSLLPYLEFKVKTDDKKIRKKIINYVFEIDNSANPEKYLEKQFEENEFFYAIDKNCWEMLINPGVEDIDFIDNSKIAEEFNIITEEERYKKLEEELNERKQNINNKNLNNKEKMKEEKLNRNAKLKLGLKYNKDFIILCGKLFDILKNNFKMNYIIKLKKIQDLIDLKSNNQLIQKEIPVDNKNLLNTDKSEDVKENIYKYENIITSKFIDLQSNKGDQSKNEFFLMEDNDLRKDVLMKESFNFVAVSPDVSPDLAKDNNKERIFIHEEEKKEEKVGKEKEKENSKEEELETIENTIKEKLNKFIIDAEKGLISKMVEHDLNLENKENEDKYILNEIDFYPIQIYTIPFGIMVRQVENAKENYAQLEKQKIYNESSDYDKRKIIESQNKENKKMVKRSQEYYDRKEKIKNERLKDKITNEEFYLKLKELKEEFNDIFSKKEKTKDDYEVDITMSEFIDTLARYKNSILIQKEKDIYLSQRYKTFKDIKKRIIDDNYNLLKDKNYNIYYFYFSTKTLFIPSDDFCFENGSNPYEPFVCIFIDIDNKEGENFYNLLVKKEKGLESKNKIIKREKERNKEEKKKPKLTDEEKRILKEKERKEKLERERIENELKLQRKKQIEEYHKRQKEAEKITSPREKELRQKEEEEEEKLSGNQLILKIEQNLKNENELEEYISPPYSIENFGNTCYINSVNQIFLNLPILQQIFLDPRINLFINKNNKFDYQRIFFELFRSLYWIQKSKIGENIKSLKKIIGYLKKDFNNSNQQDVNEYLNFLIEIYIKQLIYIQIK